MRNIRNWFLFLFLLIITFILSGSIVHSQQEMNGSDIDPNSFKTTELPNQPEEILVKGKITKILAEVEVVDPLSKRPITNQKLKVRILSGTFRGREIHLDHHETDNPVFNIKVSSGDTVSVVLMVAKGKLVEAYIVDLVREDQIYILVVLFIVLLLAIGWRKGFKAICGLLLTLILIWGVLLPGFLKGYDPVYLTIGITIISAALTLLVVGGKTLKTLTAIIGTLGGVGIAGSLALVFGKSAHLTGFGTEEASMLLYIPQNIQLDIQGLLFAGIIIGALGASMDVSMSIASAVEEIKRINPELKTGQLIRSGMNVGQDIMGTQASTLILAYTGSSVQLVLIFMAYQESLLKIINLDMVASEIIRALSASIGMIMVIPLTAVIAGMLYGGKILFKVKGSK